MEIFSLRIMVVGLDLDGDVEWQAKSLREIGNMRDSAGLDKHKSDQACLGYSNNGKVEKVVRPPGSLFSSKIEG